MEKSLVWRVLCWAKGFCWSLNVFCRGLRRFIWRLLTKKCHKIPWSGSVSRLYPSQQHRQSGSGFRKMYGSGFRGSGSGFSESGSDFWSSQRTSQQIKLTRCWYSFILSFVQVPVPVPYKPKLNDARTATWAPFLRWFPRPHPASTSPNLGLHPRVTLPKIYVLKPVMYNLDRQLY
jgi:hypothetical protein